VAMALAKNTPPLSSIARGVTMAATAQPPRWKMNLLVAISVIVVMPVSCATVASVACRAKARVRERACVHAHVCTCKFNMFASLGARTDSALQSTIGRLTQPEN